MRDLRKVAVPRVMEEKRPSWWAMDFSRMLAASPASMEESFHALRSCWRAMKLTTGIDMRPCADSMNPVSFWISRPKKSRLEKWNVSHRMSSSSSSTTAS